MSRQPLLLLEHHYRGHHPLATLIYLFSPHRWRLAGSALFFIVKQSPVWATPLIFADVVNIVSDRSSTPLHRLWIDGLILFLLLAQNVPTHMAHIRLMSESVRRVEAELRCALIRRLQQLSMGFIQNTHSGALQAKLLRDVEAVQGLCSQIINLFFCGSIAILLAVGVTARKEPRMLLFYLVAAPIAVALVRAFRGPMIDRNRDYRQQVERMSARFMEMINLLPVTRAHGLEAVEIDQMEGQLTQVRQHGMRVDILNALFGSCTWVFSQLMQLICLMVTGYLAWQGQIRAGDVVLYNSFFAMIVGSINGFVDGLPAMTRGFESVRSIGEILENPDIERNEGKAAVSEVRGRFEFRDVTFSYPNASQPAIRDFSLVVEAGQTVAVVGESGSGKTTLMSLVIGFRRPDRGHILLDGRDMETLDLRQYRRHLAVVPQQTVLFSGSIRDNITYGLSEVPEAKLQEVLRMARVDEFLADLPDGLDTEIGEHGGKLSGGQRQRIAIARALIRDPHVIILDEATSALDVISEKLVQEAITELVRGRTTFIVAHRLSTIRNASRVLVLRDGTLIESGRHDDLIRAGGEFAKLRNFQV
jgi:ATP-binding cassette subfamily B protein